jgi:hypothetical protein
MKYRATQPGFIVGRIKVGDVVECPDPDNLPIAGLVPIKDEAPEPEPAPRKHAATMADPGDAEPDVI